MTNKNEAQGKGPGKPAIDLQSGKKPTPIIDLKATEVATASPPDVASKAAFGSQSAAAGTTTAAADAPKSMPAGASASTSVPPIAGKPASAGSTSAASPGGTADAPKPHSSTATAPAGRPTPPVTPAVGPKARGGFVSHALAGVLGGGLALVGLEAFGPQLGLRTDTSGEVATRLAALEKIAKAAPAVPADVAQKIAAAESRLARLDEITKAVADIGQGQSRIADEQKTLGATVGKIAAGDGGGERLAALEDKLKALVAAAGSDADKSRIPQLAAITGQIRDLQSTLTTQLNALRASVAKDVEARITAAQEVSATARSGAERLDKEVAGVKAVAATVGQRVEALKADGERLGGAIRIVQEDIGTLKGGIDGLKVELATGLKSTAKPQDVSSAIAPITTKLASVEQNLQGVVKGEEDRRVNAERIVLALELGNLKRALDRGGRYAGELAEVRKVAGSKINVGALERFKDKGVPSLADLTREFREVAHTMLDADREPADAGVVDKLLSGARSIVRVRKVGQANDDKSTEAIAGRIEGFLKEGRLADVSEEAKKLAPKAAEAGKDWMSRVEARAAIDRAVAEIESQLKASLGGKPAQKLN